MPQPLPPNAPVVLLVDDHADTINLMARLLRGQGFDAVKADSVAAAVAVDRAIDLLICDLSLTDGTGLDVIRQLREKRPNLRGIAVSGHGSDDDRNASAAAGFARHVTKPIDFEKFIVVCREVMGQA